MTCKNCGKILLPGNRPDGLPNCLSVALKDGRRINICADCVMKTQSMTEKEKHEFLERIQAE